MTPGEIQTSKAKSRVGTRYGKLLVVAWLGSDKHRYAQYACVCDCGASVTRRSTGLAEGSSCGCAVVPRVTHGCSRRTGETPEYVVWKGIRARCRNPKNKAYRYYGGKGVKLCPRWDSFENFFADMGPRPSADMQVDRVDPAGDYCPENCRWLSARENILRSKKSHHEEVEA